MAIVRPEAIDDAPADGVPIASSQWGVSGPQRSGGWRLPAILLRDAKRAQRAAENSWQPPLRHRRSRRSHPSARSGHPRTCAARNLDGLGRHVATLGTRRQGIRNSPSRKTCRSAGPAASGRDHDRPARRCRRRGGAVRTERGRPPRPAVSYSCRHESHLIEGANRPLTVHRRRGRARCALRLRPCNPARAPGRGSIFGGSEGLRVVRAWRVDPPGDPPPLLQCFGETSWRDAHAIQSCGRGARRAPCGNRAAGCQACGPCRRGCR